MCPILPTYIASSFAKMDTLSSNARCPKNIPKSCNDLIKAMHEEMDRLGTDQIHISHRHKRYHIAKQYNRTPWLAEFVFSELMAEIC